MFLFRFCMRWNGVEGGKLLLYYHMYIHIYMRWREIRNDGRPSPAPPTRARNDMFCMMAYIHVRTWDHYQDISVCLSVCLYVVLLEALLAQLIFAVDLNLAVYISGSGTIFGVYVCPVHVSA